MRRIPSYIINREFTLFILVRILFIAGLRMTPVLMGWQLYEITGSKLALGMLGLSEVIPAILLALPAGVRVDHSNKHRLITFCIAGYLFLMLALLYLSSKWSPISGSRFWMEWSIYLVFFGTGVIRAYSSPALNSFLAQLVPTQTLVKAVSINSMTWLVAAVAGPAIGGLLLGYTGITVALTVSSALLVMALILFGFISPKPVSWKKGTTSTWDGVTEGLRFVMGQKALLSALTIDMFAVLFGGAVALLPVFAKDILHAGPIALGWLMAATYLGNFVAIAWLTAHPLKGKQGRTLIYSVGGFGISILLFALSENVWLSFIALFVGGLFDGVSVIIRGTIVQLFVPDEM
ncbi:MAG: hypothetical protein B7Z54_09355, partial [Sphingobacteriales bacterium 12-47-4]